MHSIRTLRYYAGLCDKVDGRVVNNNDGYFSYVIREPIGVCALITPWNFPLCTLISKLAPALCTGNTCVVKVSEETPLTSLRLVPLIIEAGFPPGVINILVGLGPVAGTALVRHPLVDKISFTGSTKVGKSIQQYSGETIKRITLELGGKSAAVVCADADLNSAVYNVCHGMFYNAGQICVALSRVFVHESCYDEFLSKAVEFCRSIKICDPFECDASQGPMTTEKQFNKVIMSHNILK